MSSEPFDTNLVIARVKDQVPELQLVEGAAEYAAITSLRDFRPPCAYVLLARERGDGEQQKPGGRQRSLATFGVVVAVRNYRDKRGAETMDALRPLLGKIRSALMGWKPAAPGARPCKWIQGDTLDYDANTLLWSDVYQTQTFIGGTGS